ncbi:MAG: primase-helicase family protein [Mariniphaga sp.]
MNLPAPVEHERVFLDDEIDDNIYIQFWFNKTTDKTKPDEWKIDHRLYNEYLKSTGLRRFGSDDNFIFIKIKQGVIYIVTITQIIDQVLEYIKNLDESNLNGIPVEVLESKFYSSPSTYFNRIKMSLIGEDKNLSINSDDKDSGYIYFSNCFVKCTSEGYEAYEYNKLPGYVFHNQIKNRKFKKASPEGMFKEFVFNISGKNNQRFNALKTMIGYLLHSFYETKMKAVNLTDSMISENAEGRTGKTLLGRAISHIKNVCEISGKDFDPSNKHKYQTAKIDSQIIFLNDLKKKFDFESLFNDISDAISIERKNMQPITIQAKMLIAANDTFRVEGASAQDRVIEFELANHYNVSFSPENEFGVWFFRDWDSNEWSKFDNFMMSCLSLYLKNGVLEADPINLDKRKQLQVTNRDFMEFMEKEIKEGIIVRRGNEFDKRELHTKFIQEYPEYKERHFLNRTSNFIVWLKAYAAHSPELRGDIAERPSNGKYLICFKKEEDQQNELPF